MVPYDGPNYRADRALLTVTSPWGGTFNLTPERRFYPVRSMPTSEAAISTNWFSDLYLVLGEFDGTGKWTLRAYHHPLVPAIWIGAMIMTAGGVVSLSDRRLRIGAPSRRRPAQAKGAA